MLPEIKAYMAKARLRRGIEMVKLANRIETLKAQEEDTEDSDFPADAISAADQSKHVGAHEVATGEKRSLSKTIKGAIFREVVLAKVREMKQQQDTLKVKEDAEKEHRRRSFQG